MKVRVTPTQLEALLHGHYLDEDATLVLEGTSIAFEDRDVAWRELVDACNLADEWATKHRTEGETVLAKHAARDSRALGALSSKVIRAT